MGSVSGLEVFALNVHADYACRHAGACCTAGWHIPVEPEAMAAARAHPRAVPAAWFTTVAPPDGAEAVLVQRDDGACAAFDRAAGNLCAIQRAGGHAALPVACQLFPRVPLVDARGVHVTLSHFCPTAAQMLFREDLDRVEVVVCTDGALRRERYEGFDATATVPPFLRPGVLSDAPTTDAWERFAVATLTDRTKSAEESLTAVARAADRLRAWTPADGPLDAWAPAMLGANLPAVPDAPMTEAAAARLFQMACASVPAGLPRPVIPDALRSTDERYVRPAWRLHARVAGRYLAARAFAAWSAYQGEGLRTQVAILAVTLGVLRVECIRQAAGRQRALDGEMLLEAIRQSDWLLVHLSSSDVLVRRVGHVERMPADEYLESLGLGCPAGA